MNNKKCNIVICDDHRLFRKGMSSLLSDFDSVGEIQEACSGVQLLSLLEENFTLPDLVLLDINMPEMDGVETTQKLKKRYPDVRILILSMEDDAQLVSHLINEGVNGYLLKNADPDELELAIKKVMRNDFYFTSALSGAVLSSLKLRNKAKLVADAPKLTEREIEVLKLICKELTASEIAEKIFLSARTVEGYKRKLLEKTNTKNMAGLVIYAIKNNIVDI